MYRERVILKPTREGWPEAIENARRLSELAELRGRQEATIWTQSFGPFNEIVIETDYPDLATYEREHAEASADEEARELRAEGRQYLRADAMGHNELWERV
jgi:hypothetical protein